MLKVEVSNTGTGTVYLKDGENFIVISPPDIPELMSKLSEGLGKFNSNIKWEWKDDIEPAL